MTSHEVGSEPHQEHGLPARLSPSRAKDFVQCPQLFYFKTILGLRSPPTLATAKGNVAHLAFEHLFDHPRDARTREVGLSYVAPAWKTMAEPLVSRADVAPGSPEAIIRESAGLFRETVEAGSAREATLVASGEEYRALAPPGSAIEETLLADTSKVVGNYFDAEIERPWNFDPEGRELHLEATTGDVTLHGFIDRLDRYVTQDGEERWVISDYKTGKVPSERYLGEAFFAMKVYALLLSESRGIQVHSLRLVYVAAPRHRAIQAQHVDASMLASTKVRMNRIWAQIVDAAATGVWETKKQRLCDWCSFKDQCPAWTGGTEPIVRSSTR